MAIKSLVVPILTGGAIAVGALVLSNARRFLSVRVRSPQRRATVESDPIGLGDDDDLTPEPTTPVKVRTEAEATAAAGAAWPLPSIAASDTAAESLMPGGAPWRGSSSDSLDSEGTNSEGTNSARSEHLAPKSMSEPLLDFDIDVDDFESRLTARGNDVLERSDAEQYDAVDPDNLGQEWLIRATEATGGGGSSTIDDLSELPMELNPLMSEASIRAAEFSEDDISADAAQGGGGRAIGQRSRSGESLDPADAEEDEEEDAALWDSSLRPEGSQQK